MARVGSEAQAKGLPKGRRLEALHHSQALGGAALWLSAAAGMLVAVAVGSTTHAEAMAADALKGGTRRVVRLWWL